MIFLIHIGTSAPSVQPRHIVQLCSDFSPNNSSEFSPPQRLPWRLPGSRLDSQRGKWRRLRHTSETHRGRHDKLFNKLIVAEKASEKKYNFLLIFLQTSSYVQVNKSLNTGVVSLSRCQISIVPDINCARYRPQFPQNVLSSRNGLPVSERVAALTFTHEVALKTF